MRPENKIRLGFIPGSCFGMLPELAAGGRLGFDAFHAEFFAR